MRNALLRYFCGTVEFKADGEFAERFINLAARENLGLWDIQRTDTGLIGKMHANRYKSVRSVAKRSGMRTRMTTKKGLPFTLLAYRRRAGFALGGVLFFLIIWTMSGFVWFVDFPDCDEALKEKIKTSAVNNGIYVGAKRSELDGANLSTLIELSVSELSWASVNIFGSWVSIDIREYDSFIETIPSNDPSNIVARKDAIITEVHALSGFAVVQPGDIVAAGELLISGVVEDSMGGVSIVHSQGSVIARTELELTETVYFQQQTQLPTGKVITFGKASLFGFEIPLFIGDLPAGTFEKSRSTTPLRIGNIELPISFIRETWHETAQMTHTVTRSEALLTAQENMQLQIDALDILEVIKKTEYVDVLDDRVVLTVKLTVSENIAKEEIITFN